MSQNYELISVQALTMDQENPRIALWLDQYDGDIPEEQITMALGVAGESESEGPSMNSGGSYRSLKESIKTNGGIIHPIVVSRQQDSTLLVIEGNTRTAIYRELQEEQPGAAQWKTIPAIVHDNLNQKDIDSIRLQAHLVGPRDWDAYSKAKYLYNLSVNQNLTADQIVAFCGGKRREVEDYINAYRDMEKHYRPISGDQGFEHKCFSAFVELQRPRIVESLLRHHFTKGDFAQWVYDHKFRPLQTVRQLPKFLQNQAAREAFLSFDAEEAEKVLVTPAVSDALKDLPFLDLAREFYRRVDSLTWSMLQQIKRQEISEERDLMDETRNLLNEVLKVILDE